MQAHDRVQWVYSSKDNQELAGRYDQWASDYDSDLENVFGWSGPKRAAEDFSRYVSKEAKVLDAGAGTGLVGQCLAELGYHNLVAIDLSAGMLEIAGKKKVAGKDVYTELHQMTLGETLEFPTASFDAVISVGVFTLGHAPASSFRELTRITKPGGYIVFAIRPDVFQNKDFKEIKSELELAGKWKFVEKGEEFKTLPKGEPEVYHQVWIFKISAGLDI
jgi:SAM-dependent methyltransferase